MLAPVVHRGPLQRLSARGVRGEAERPKVAGQVRQPERLRLVQKVFEEAPSVGRVVIRRRTRPFTSTKAQGNPFRFGGNNGGETIEHDYVTHS